MREDDYYRLAVCFEVVEQVVALLVDMAIAKDELSRRFVPEVYAAADSSRAALTSRGRLVDSARINAQSQPLQREHLGVVDDTPPSVSSQRIV